MKFLNRIKMRRLISQLALVCVLPFLSQTVFAQHNVQAEVTRALQDQELVGASWVIINGSQSQTGSAGFSNALTQAPLLPTQQVQVGSITKTLIATYVLSLVSDGRLSLDALVSELLPSLKLDNPWRDTHPVKVRHLLDHTAGVQSLRLWHILNTRATPDAALDSLFESDPELLHVTAPPGDYFHYSNMAYNLLAMLIEKTTGQRYEDALKKGLLEPLEMNHSTFHFVSQSTQVNDGSEHALAYGHLDAERLIESQASFLRAAGQFTTTPADMQKFMAFLMSDGVVGGSQFVKTALLRSMGTAAATLSQKAGLPSGGQLGLWRRDRHGVIGKCHGGNTIGYKSMMCFFSEQNKAFFVAVNADSETSDYEQVYKIFIKHLNVPDVSTEVADAPPDDEKNWYGLYRLFPEFFSFAYLDRIFNVIHLGRDNEGLRLWSPASEPVRLKYISGRLYSSANRASISHVLIKDPLIGNVISSGFQNYMRFNIWTWGAMALSLTLGLLAFFFIVLRGLYLSFSVKLEAFRWPIMLPFLVVPCSLLTVPFFLKQSFMEIGNFNIASFLVAFISVAALALCIPALLFYRRNKTLLSMDSLAVLAFFQWTLVLAYWGLIPFQLWNL